MTFFLRESSYGRSYFMIELHKVGRKLDVESSADLAMCFDYILDESIEKSKRELFANYIYSLDILSRRGRRDLTIYKSIKRAMKNVAKELDLEFVED